MAAMNDEGWVVSECGKIRDIFETNNGAQKHVFVIGTMLAFRSIYVYVVFRSVLFNSFWTNLSFCIVKAIGLLEQ